MKFAKIRGVAGLAADAVHSVRHRADHALFDQYSAAVTKARETGKPADVKAANALKTELETKFPGTKISTSTA